MAAWRDFNILWERAWPWIGATAAALLWFHAEMEFPRSSETLLGTAATVASIFASFLGVAEALIIGLRGTASYQVLTKAGYTDLLFGYLRAGVLSAVLFACLSVLGFFIPLENSLTTNPEAHIFSAVWIFSGSLALLTFIRISNILFKLLHQP